MEAQEFAKSQNLEDSVITVINQIHRRQPNRSELTGAPHQHQTWAVCTRKSTNFDDSNRHINVDGFLLWLFSLWLKITPGNFEMPLIPEDGCCILPSHQHSSTISTIDLSPHLAQQHTNTGWIPLIPLCFGHVTLVLTTPLPVAKHEWPPSIASCSNSGKWGQVRTDVATMSGSLQHIWPMVYSPCFPTKNSYHTKCQVFKIRCEQPHQPIFVTFKPSKNETQSLTSQALLTFQVVRQASEPPVGLCNTFLFLSAIRWRVHAAVSKQLNPSSHHGVGKRPYHDGNYSGSPWLLEVGADCIPSFIYLCSVCIEFTSTTWQHDH